MERKHAGGLVWYESALLKARGLIHGFGTKDIGMDQYVRVCCADQPRAMHIPVTRQVHGAVVHRLDRPADEELVGDGFLTATPGIVLPIRTADCLPILLVDPVRRVIGAVHAGWRGLAAGILPEAIALAARAYGVVPTDLRCAIGPAIGGACYQVGNEVIESIGKTVDAERVAMPDGPGRWRLDLGRCAHRQLEGCGVPPEQIDVATDCTHCRPMFWHSHRREPADDGRQYSFICLRGC